MMSVLSMEVILGSLTFTGSLMAAGKLQEILPQRPILFLDMTDGDDQIFQALFQALQLEFDR